MGYWISWSSLFGTPALVLDLSHNHNSNSVYPQIYSSSGEATPLSLWFFTSDPLGTWTQRLFHSLPGTGIFLTVETERRDWRSRSCANWEAPHPHLCMGQHLLLRVLGVLYFAWLCRVVTWLLSILPLQEASMKMEKTLRTHWSRNGAWKELWLWRRDVLRNGVFWLCFVLYPEAVWHKLLDLTPELWVKPSPRCQRRHPHQCPNYSLLFEQEHFAVLWTPAQGKLQFLNLQGGDSLRGRSHAKGTDGVL